MASRHNDDDDDILSSLSLDKVRQFYVSAAISRIPIGIPNKSATVSSGVFEIADRFSRYVRRVPVLMWSMVVIQHVVQINIRFLGSLARSTIPLTNPLVTVNSLSIEQ